MRGAVAFDAAFVGIHTGGAWLAERLAALIPGDHPLGFIDVSFYRDDFRAHGPQARAPSARDLPFDVDGATIVLVDDVLYTGRTVRAAINELFDYGRPGARSSSPCWSTAAAASCRSRPTYVGARLAVARDLSIVLSRADDGTPALGVEPAAQR